MLKKIGLSSPPFSFECFHFLAGTYLHVTIYFNITALRGHPRAQETFKVDQIVRLFCMITISSTSNEPRHEKTNNVDSDQV